MFTRGTLFTFRVVEYACIFDNTGNNLIGENLFFEFFFQEFLIPEKKNVRH